MNITLPNAGKSRAACAAVIISAMCLAGGASAEPSGPTPGVVLLAAQSGTASDIPVNPQHPDSYTVVDGDTLWDIAGIFLRDPWYWPEIWHINPQIDNPHLIYPGDILTMVYVDGQPQIRMQRGAGATRPGDDRTVEQGSGTERLSPQIRAEALDEAITTISAQDVAVFFNRGTVLEKGSAGQMPRIVAFRDHLVAGAGVEVFIKNMDGVVGERYTVVRQGEPLVDPDDNTVVGYQGIYIGEGTLRANGDPATLFLNDTTREANTGDLIMTMDQDVPLNFFPRAPAQQVDGQIISVIDGVSRIGQYQTVVINRGARDGVESGSVLKVWAAGEISSDRYSIYRKDEKILLPAEMVGTLMVIRAHDRISYGLIMEATGDIRVLHAVRSP